MNRARQQQLILGALVCVMVGVYVRALRRLHHAAPPAAPAVEVSIPGREPPVSVTFSLPDRSAQRDAQRQEAARLMWDRDPFTRGASMGQASGFTLSGILWDAASPIAILNGQMLHVGDELDGYRVLEIAPDHVAVSDGVETFQLSIVP